MNNHLINVDYIVHTRHSKTCNKKQLKDEINSKWHMNYINSFSVSNNLG